ncbi:MAG: vitamin K epoxide reductase family protein [Desulfomonile sp.]
MVSNPIEKKQDANPDRLVLTDTNDGQFFSGAPPFLAILLLGFIGTFAAGFLTYRHVLLASQAGAVDESFLCRSVNNINCDAVLLSPYAVIFDFIPSSVLGLVGFTFLLWLSLSGLLNPRIRREAWAGLLIYLFVAIVFSWYYAYIMLFDLDFICPWCVVVHLVNLVALAVVLTIAVKKRRRFELPATAPVGERVCVFLGGAMAALLVFFVTGFLENSLSYNDVKKKYDDLSDNPIVVASLLKVSPDYEITVQETDPVYGESSAPYPIIFFSDFQCPVCLRKEIFLRAVVDLNPSYLKLVFKNYPLSSQCNARIVNNLHPVACEAAQAAHAAFIIGGVRSFWDYADLVYAQQRQLKSRPWNILAEQMGLETARFTALMEPGSPAEKKVREDVDLGTKLGLDSTPEIFFERKKIPPNLRGEHFVSALEDLIRANHPEQRDLKLTK